MGLPTQDPDDRLDYPIDWSRWLAKVGDTIVNSTWTDITPGITTSDEAFTTTATVVYIEGGEEGERYSLTNQITTAEGRRRSKTISVVIREK